MCSSNVVPHWAGAAAGTATAQEVLRVWQAAQATGSSPYRLPHCWWACVTWRQQAEERSGHSAGPAVCMFGRGVVHAGVVSQHCALPASVSRGDRCTAAALTNLLLDSTAGVDGACTVVLLQVNSNPVWCCTGAAVTVPWRVGSLSACGSCVVWHVVAVASAPGAGWHLMGWLQAA